MTEYCARRDCPDNAHAMLPECDFGGCPCRGCNRRINPNDSPVNNENECSSFDAGTLSQSQPTAAELLSELTTLILGWHSDDEVFTLAKRAHLLGYGVAHPKAVAP